MPSSEDLRFANYSSKLGRIITGRNCSLLEDGRQRRHFGIEIEACDYDPNDNVDYETGENAKYCLFSPFDGMDNLGQIKDDCSLIGNHFEFITAPMTMKLLKGLNWAGFFDVIRSADYQQTDFNEGDAAGIHVHVNRKSFHHPFEAAVNALAFITENEDTIRRFARRSKEQWDNWCSSPYELSHCPDRFIRRIKNGDYSQFGYGYDSRLRVDETRYTSVNFCSHNTWELRIFNSTLKTPEMYNILDFAEALWELADTDHYEMSLEAMSDKLMELGNPTAANEMFHPPMDTYADYNYGCDRDD